MYKKECIAMLLAGGQGSRLGVLTREIAKPAVPFGGKYRIIDFTLSNCVNSGFDTVGVLTQYMPHVLNDYIGNGQPWDLDRKHGGVYVLPPFLSGIRSEDGWYKGTANAIYRNIRFIEKYNPEYLLVLSGDHIYKMDYSKMLEHHKNRNADCTIAVLDVPIDEASRFGIMNTHGDGTIYEFEEKPKNPKSTKASMGIYVFSWKKLKTYLEADEASPDSSNDFGKNIIPAMLNCGENMQAWEFDGYWKDVGTIESLWDSNMDLLNPNLPLKLHDKSWKIYSRNPVQPPHYIGKDAEVKHSFITEGGVIYGYLDYSVIFHSVHIEKDASVEFSVVMPGAKICKGAKVSYSIVGENAVIGENCIIGDSPENVNAKNQEWGITVVGADSVIQQNMVVAPGQMISNM